MPPLLSYRVREERAKLLAEQAERDQIARRTLDYAHRTFRYTRVQTIATVLGVVLAVASSGQLGVHDDQSRTAANTGNEEKVALGDESVQPVPQPEPHPVPQQRADVVSADRLPGRGTTTSLLPPPTPSIYVGETPRLDTTLSLTNSPLGITSTLLGSGGFSLDQPLGHGPHASLLPPPTLSIHAGGEPPRLDAGLGLTYASLSVTPALARSDVLTVDSLFGRGITASLLPPPILSIYGNDELPRLDAGLGLINRAR